MKKDDLQELFDSFSELQKTSEPPQVSDNSIDMDKYLEWLDKSLKRRRYQNDTRNRNILAFWTMAIICVWMIFIGVIVVICGRHLFLSDVVLVALLGTTTATVLGLAAIVLRGYFKSNQMDRRVDD